MPLGQEHFWAHGRATSGHRLIEVAGGPQCLKKRSFFFENFRAFFGSGRRRLRTIGVFTFDMPHPAIVRRLCTDVCVVLLGD